MPEYSRSQVRTNDTERPWEDVGHDSTDQKLPINIYDSSGNIIDSFGGGAAIASYQTNDIDDGDTATDVVYIGLEKDDVTW